MAFAGHPSALSGDTVTTVPLDSVVVSGGARGGQLRALKGGAMVWDLSMVDKLPKIMGVADPMHYAQMLPGVSVNSEYDAGLRVHGCENGHNVVSLNGAPVYGAAHLLGIFSVFIPTHFRRMALSKDMADAALPNRLGASVDMRTAEAAPPRLRGEATAGLMASAATLDVPDGRQGHLLVSLRGSYVNLLYGPLLRDDDMSMRYSFADANLSYTRAFGDNRFSLDAYWGKDNCSYVGRKIYSDMDMTWGNAMVAAGWRHTGDKAVARHKLFFTRYQASDDVAAEALSAKTKASISEWGYKGKVQWAQLTAGADISLYALRPQGYSVGSSFVNMQVQEDVRHAAEVSAYADYRQPLTRHLAVSGGLRAAFFTAGGHRFGGCFPSLGLLFDSRRRWDAALRYSFRKQFLVQTGLSSLGSPLEYWVCSGLYGLRPQSAHNLSATAGYTSADGMWTVMGEAYVKWLAHQVEYNGTLFAMLSTDYSLRDALLSGKGLNYGVNITLMKNRGWLTGWLSYAYSPAKRTFHTPQLEGTFHSSHERLHEFKGVATAKASRRMDLGMTVVCATGTPYTRPEQLMVFGKHLLPLYGSYNGSRLAAYFRIDVSADYCLKRARAAEHWLNLSVYNCTARKNELFWYLHAGNSTFNYRSMRNLMSVLPSLSYTVKF